VEVQFAQKLAANEPWVRDKAVKKLKKWFGARQGEFEEVEMMKLWKGLYYCFWMSDKPLVQEELAENMASFIPSFQSNESSLVFIKSFLKTFGREWFGIDRWRMDKFMMFTRRFLRHIFKFVAAKEWEKSLVEKVVEVFRDELVLCPVADTSLGFQLHFTDVFLEELAKVGGENLDPDVLEMFLEPYVEVVRVGNEVRFRDHVVERIFNHLMRQSDPGIDWQMEEEGEGMEEGMEEEEGMGEEEECEDGSDDENGDNNVSNGGMHEEEDEGKDIEAVEDPRAGRVDAVIPQMKVEYSRLSEKLFELGSGEGVRKSNRDALYKISKMFKDVANDVFPLGPNLSDEEIDIPKISVKKSAADLLKRNELILKKNLEEKIKNKKLMSKMSQKAKVETPQNGVDSGESEETHENGDAAEESSSDEETEEAVQKEKKLSSKDLRRKRKQEQKKRKREKALQIEKEKVEKDKKAQEVLEQELDLKSAITNGTKSQNNGVLQDKDEKIEEKVDKLKALEKKKNKKEKALSNGVDVNSDNLAVKELIKLAEDLEQKSEMSAKKNKKKKKKNKGDDEISTNPNLETTKAAPESAAGDLNVGLECPKESISESLLSITKKKKKKKDREVLDTTIPTPDTSQFFTPNTSIAVATENEDLDESTVELTASKKKKKKLKRSATDAALGHEGDNVEIETLVKEDVEKSKDLTASSKKKKLKKSATEAKLDPEGNVEGIKSAPEEVVEDSMKKPSEEITTSMMKKKKKKKEMYRIDSDIAFNTPSLSAVNLTIVEKKLAQISEAELPQESISAKNEAGSAKKKKKKSFESEKSLPSTPVPIEVSSTKKNKKMKKYNAETSLLNANDEETTKPVLAAPAFLQIDEEKNDTPKSEKKKKKKLDSNKLEFGTPVAQEPGVKPKSCKVFEEDNSWEEPIRPGETEIVLPNKNYKGTLKLAEPATASVEAESLPGFSTPLVTPVKSYTSTFLKKALSKSVDPKKVKKEKKASLGKEKCLSEPRKKKVNIVLTQNKSQDIPQHLKSVKNSPQTPHDPAKNPARGVLKKRVSLESGTRLNPVQLNTQLNGRSKAAKVMNKKRKSAMDFF